jgi:hypothetical protein
VFYYQLSKPQHGHTFAFQHAVKRIREFLIFSSRTKSSGETGIDGFLELDSYITQEDQIRSLFELFSANRIAFANTPYFELFTDDIRTIVENKHGFLINKPNNIYRQTFLRSMIFRPWDPILMKRMGEMDTLPDDLQEFIDLYCLREKKTTIDSYGDRITLPLSTANDIILIIGDSVAFGVLLSDNETLASQLQQVFPDSLRFINASVGGCGINDNLSRLRDRLQTFGSRVKGVIYVHCENDFTVEDTPEILVQDLTKILDDFAVPYRAFVYQQYIYRTMPDLFRNNSIVDYSNFQKLKHQTITLGKSEHFDVVDFYDVVDQYRMDLGTPLAGFSLYVDHCHLSALGIRLVKDRLTNGVRNMLGNL